MEASTVRRITRVWAQDAARFATTLATVDPTWGSETFALAGGTVVLCGPGLYVNRALAVGEDRPLTDAEWARLEQRSAAVGVPASIELTDASAPGLREAVRARGYVLDDSRSALARSTDLRDLPPPDPSFEVVPANGALLSAWQETAAAGWGHTAAAARYASDVCAAVAARVDGDGLMLLRRVGSERSLGCATLTIRDGLATLGGMSTLPDARGQGVQTTLIRHRLRAAAAAGCDLATSVAATGGGSERNLLRHGFERVFTIEQWAARSDPTGPVGRTGA